MKSIARFVALAAFVAVASAQESNPSEDAKTRFERGKVYYQQQDYGKAIAEFSAALAARNSYPEAYYHRGLSHMATRAWGKAAEDFTAGIQLANYYPEAHLQLGRVHHELEKYLSSLREYTIAIQQRPGFAEAYKGRSAVRAALGDSLGAKADLQTAGQ